MGGTLSFGKWVHDNASLSSSSRQADFSDFGAKAVVDLKFLLRVELFHLQQKPVDAELAK